MFAIRSDLSLKAKQIPIKSKAEILSVELKLNSNYIICVTTCYRVGTLGETNHKEVDSHLRAIARNKKYKNHIVLGDFNMANTSWPDAESSNNTENLFIDSFNDLGLHQLIDDPIHDKGRILDLLLTDRPGLITDL